MTGGFAFNELHDTMLRQTVGIFNEFQFSKLSFRSDSCCRMFPEHFLNIVTREFLQTDPAQYSHIRNLSVWHSYFVLVLTFLHNSISS